MVLFPRPTFPNKQLVEGEQPKPMARRGGITTIAHSGAFMARGGATGATAFFAQRLKHTSFVASKEDSYDEADIG